MSLTTKEKKKNRENATIADVCQWLKDGVFHVENGRVFKGNKEIAQRINRRRRSDRGDPRVDLWHDGKRRSCNVSALVWMQETQRPIPTGYEIHHFDENPLNNEFSNLICVHSLDHLKLHANWNPEPF